MYGLSELRGIVVCVEYNDFLSITLPHNRHHFSEFMVVTTPAELETQRLAYANNCRVHTTEAFYDNGADFNKWKALEEALDKFGRHGWMCLMDADVLWPHESSVIYTYEIGNLYVPYRRMFSKVARLRDGLPPEDTWKLHPRHRLANSFSGYSQIFHATDPHLPSSPPWHDITWKHAGGADTFFFERWHPSCRVRPPWEVLHLGEPVQWTGRTAPFLNGEIPTHAKERKDKLTEYMLQRRKNRGYDHEKVSTE